MNQGISREGFITEFLYTGRKEEKMTASIEENNQLVYEDKLRELIVLKEEMPKVKNEEWKYYYSYGNAFLEDSHFYLSLHGIKMQAKTIVIAKEECKIGLNIWSYGGVNLWVNDCLVGKIKTPVYKPIQKEHVEVNLKQGENEIFVDFATAGIRDTRINLGLQFEGEYQSLEVKAFTDHRFLEVYGAARILDAVELQGNKLISKEIFPSKTYIVYQTGTPDFYKKEQREIKKEISGEKEIILEGYSNFYIQIENKEGAISRSLEQGALIQPIWKDLEGKTKEEISRSILEDIATVRSLKRDENNGFSMYPLLARYALGRREEYDKEELFITLAQIEKRIDCADFMICAMIRYIHNYEVSEELEIRMKEVMLNFRYWMNQEGEDAMCFWSENHTLMFYQAAYFFGKRYPEEWFKRANRKGSQLAAWGKERLEEWLRDVIESGFDEFNSGVYTAITFSALLNVIDYGEEKLAKDGKLVADQIVIMMSRHVFDGVIISPQGRVYRDVLYPQRQHLQALLYYIDQKVPYVYNEWLSALATSTYQFPEIEKDREELLEITYPTSNALINIYKQKEYILTSVDSPRRDGRERVWEFEMKEEKSETFIYTKSLNECFHGTMVFKPGTEGYQQHMWYAALAKDLVIFTNHPGGYCEKMGESRPGYWFGNGSMPSLRQERNKIYISYDIPENHPVKFTHLFWQQDKFEKEEVVKNWIFGQKGNSYIGIWCNKEWEPYNDMLFGAEKRNYGTHIEYLCVVGAEKEYGSFDDFIKKVEEEDVYI